ncbi:hypothetical protein GCM10023196_088230 [Actinoallomurus vinaceus]|uniref:Protein kinase domain-containing protein n=1 Tax=Actinoallomurus vinaceus TaxID=1080074 RepID=A0ABP8USA2_9ACTN
MLSARLGAGGMGEVFFGRSPGGRPVAVKLVHPVYAADGEFRRRFKREVEAARTVGGFHTAPVVDADPDADRPWMVTAYVAGPSLAEALAEHGPLPAVTLRTLGAGLADALKAIHKEGLIHRDLKPSNILLAADGPRVIDFGIARAVDASGATARVGTPGFMSPELLTGQPLTPACDVFALGLVLAHAAGVRPFGEGPVEALNYRIVHQDPDLTGLDGGLADVVHACLAKDPAGRPTPAALIGLLSDGGEPGPWLPGDLQTMVATRLAPASEPPTGGPRTPSHTPFDGGAKSVKQAYRCAECGWQTSKWVGRCGACQAWGTVDVAGAAKPARVVTPGVVYQTTLRNDAGSFFSGLGGVVLCCFGWYGGVIRSPRPVWFLIVVGAIFGLLGVFLMYEALRGSARRLVITASGLDVTVGEERHAYEWDDVAKVTIMRHEDGEAYIYVYPNPHWSPPKNAEEGPGNGWVPVGRIDEFGTPPKIVEKAIAHYAGPVWEPPPDSLLEADSADVWRPDTSRS